MKNLPNPGPTFNRRKEKILSQLSVPDEEYTDASPKGSVDAGIRDLIGHINAHAGLVTTSSCAGRVSVYLEGRKATQGRGIAGSSHLDVSKGSMTGGTRNAGSLAGGKGGGEWLFVSHDAVDGAVGEEGYEGLLGLQSGGGGAVQAEGLDSSSRLIHFKFEPMILHVLTASLEHAQLVIQAGMEAGFRESGALGLLKRQPDEEAMPMVAVRSMGLSFESLIGVETDGIRRPIVTSGYLKTLVQIANERFDENQKRIARFRTALEAAFAASKGRKDWEDPQARRERKRQEGLRRREELEREERKAADGQDELSLDSILQQPNVL